MKYTIRIAALAVLISALIVVYSDLLESDNERLQVEQNGASKSVSQAAPKSSPTYLFQDILENAVVVVKPVPEYASTPKDPAKKYNKMLRVASFKSLDRAEELKDLLITKEFVNVQMVKNTNSDWHYITVGPFSSRSMLNKAQDQLAQMNYVTQVISVK